jgi:hypothetical protein
VDLLQDPRRYAFVKQVGRVVGVFPAERTYEIASGDKSRTLIRRITTLPTGDDIANVYNSGSTPTTLAWSVINPLIWSAQILMIALTLTVGLFQLT